MYDGILSAFSNEVEGTLYDPSLVSNLNQLSTGTTPVTVATDPVGLILDSRLGLVLGPELVTNGDFSNGTTGWSAVNGATLAVVDGELEVTGAGGSYPLGTRNITTVIGNSYKCVVTCRRGTSASNARIICGTPYVDTSSTSNVQIQQIFVAVATTTAISCAIGSATGTGTVYFDNISVKLLEGNHAIQATAAARPTWEVDADGNYYLKFLGTDDSLASATGGGGSAGFFWCGVVEPTGGAGAVRILFSDRTVASFIGYSAYISVTNKLSLQAGNGVGYTSHESTATVNVDTKYLLTVWDDGTNLNVQINSAAAETVARPVVVAGTAGFTIGKDNGIAQYYFIGNLYPFVYVKGSGLTAAQRAAVQAYCRMKGGL